MLESDHWHPLATRFIDASIDWKLSERVKVRAGQFKYDFDIEARGAAHMTSFIERALITNRVAGSLDGASTSTSTGSAFRDRGVSVIGDSSRWGWAVGVFQGSGRGKDDDHDHGTVANLRLKPREGLILNTGVIASDENAYRAWTAGASWDVNARLFFRGEVYRARHDVSGEYVSAAVTVLPSLDLLARVQRFAENDETSSVDSVDIGAKWFLRRRDRRSGTSIAINYMHRDEPVLAMRVQVRF